jgi:acetamidase/formamidase
MGMGMDPALDRCVEMALRDMILSLGQLGGFSGEDACTLCSLAVDCRVTQTVNSLKGVHAMLAKRLLARGGYLQPASCCSSGWRGERQN